MFLQVERTSELGRKEATTEEVDYVNRELKKLYKISGSKYFIQLPRQHVDNNVNSILSVKLLFTERMPHISGRPICYFEFITDPDSFGHTIENMFYVSFLVKVRLYLIMRHYFCNDGTKKVKP